jgi:two-component system cell cycle response regulator
MAAGKVLIVLNDASEARAIADRLGENGIETCVALDGIAGLAAVSEQKPDLVLCSKSLPKMSGLEVCKLIKRNHKHKHVTVLVLLGEDDDTVSSLEVGANDYLIRPLHMAELVAAIRSHLHSKTSITKLKDDNKELATILEISEMLAFTLNSGDLHYIIVHEVAKALAVERCTLLRVDPSGQRATIEASMSPDDADNPTLRLSDLPEVRRCLASNRMVYVEDTRRDPELNLVHEGQHFAVLSTPLATRQQSAGRLVFRMVRQAEPFTYREIKFCQIVTTMAGNALENASLYESLEIAHAQLTEISKKDPLTDVFNRRYLFERLEVEFARSVRKGTPLSIVLLDIDHFKRINDDFGHQAGDATLISIGRLLKESLRGQDLVGRYGGEEFLVVLPETDQEGSRLVAERIRSAVGDHAFQGVGQRHVTASLGAAVRAPGDTSTRGVEALIAQADQALYEAKDSGRDRVICYQPAPQGVET